MKRMPGWTGRRDRHPVEIDAVVYRGDGSKSDVVLTNFSEEGCRIEAEQPFAIGEQFQIAIPRMGSLTAQVRWAVGSSAGARFLVRSGY